LAALELERSVVASVRSILDDHSALAITLQEAGASAAEIDSFLKASQAKNLSFDPPKIAELVTRVDLRQDGMELSINLEVLLPRDPANGPTPWAGFTRFVPLQLKRRGFAMRLVIDVEASTRKTDVTLLRAVARGHKWFEKLVSGRAGFAREIAAREGVNERFVRRLIPLAFLSPSIVEAIADGRQPISLTAEALSRGIDISPDWDKQFAALGFEPGIVT
jgi:site-specific DNA recombinase